MRHTPCAHSLSQPHLSSPSLTPSFLLLLKPSPPLTSLKTLSHHLSFSPSLPFFLLSYHKLSSPPFRSSLKHLHYLFFLSSFVSTFLIKTPLSSLPLSLFPSSFHPFSLSFSPSLPLFYLTSSFRLPLSDLLSDISIISFSFPPFPFP